MTVSSPVPVGRGKGGAGFIDLPGTAEVGACLPDDLAFFFFLWRGGRQGRDRTYLAAGISQNVYPFGSLCCFVLFCWRMVAQGALVRMAVCPHTQEPELPSLSGCPQPSSEFPAVPVCSVLG